MASRMDSEAMRICATLHWMVIALLLSASLAAQDFCRPWAEARGDFGSKRSIGRAELFLPVWTLPRGAVFCTARALWDSDDNVEGDIGLGARRLGRRAVVGCYTFFDVKCNRRHRTFEQVTVGLDGYTACWEARVNGYLPVTGGHELPNTSFAEGRIIDGRVFVVGHGNNVERGMPGVDGEIGRRLFLCRCLELRGLLGFYYFERRHYPRFIGPRGRAELTWRGLPFFGPASSLTVGVEGQYDNIRAGRLFGLVRLHLPLGVPLWVSRVPCRQKRCCNSCCCLAMRMGHRVERLDLLTAVREGDPCGCEATFQGRPFTNIAFVNAATADVPAVVTAAGPGSLVLFDGSLGTIETVDTIAMQLQQVLAGGGAVLELDSVCCGPAPFEIPGERPRVERQNEAGPVVEMSTEGTVAGLDLVGGNTGVLIDGVNDALLTQSSVTTIAAGAPAVSITGGSLRAHVTMSRLSTFGANSDVVVVEAASNDALIEDSLLMAAAGGARGLHIDTVTGTHLLRSEVRVLGANTPAVQIDNAQNSLLEESSISAADGFGVLLVGSDGTGVLKSEVAAGGLSVAGVQIVDSDNVTVIESHVSTTGDDSSAVVVTQGSQGANIVLNVIATVGDGDAAGVLFDGMIPITSGNVTSNAVVTRGDVEGGQFGPAGVALVTDVSNVTVHLNEVLTQGEGASAVFLDGVSNVSVAENTLTTQGPSSHGVHLASSSAVTNLLVTISENSIATTGAESRGILGDAIPGGGDQAAIKAHVVTENTIRTSGDQAAALEFGDFLDGTITNNSLTTTGTNADAVHLGQLSNNAAAVYLVNDNSLVASGDDSNGLVADGTSNGQGLMANRNAFLAVAEFVVDLDASVVNGEDNTWTEQGGGSLCNFMGGVAGTIEFDVPEGGSCP